MRLVTVVEVEALRLQVEEFQTPTFRRFRN